MSKFYYLIPGEEKGIFSILVEDNGCYNNGKNGRWKYPAGSGETTAGLIEPIEKNVSGANQLNWGAGYKYNIKFTIGLEALKTACGGTQKGWRVQDYLVDFLYDVDSNCKYLAFNNNGDLLLKEHKKGKFTAKVKREKKVLAVTETNIILNGPKTYETQSEVYSISDSSDDSKDIKSGWTYTITVTMTFSNGKVLAKKGEFDIGADYSGSNTGSNYCFYCKDNTRIDHLAYLCTVPYVTIDKHEARIHSCTKHNDGAVPQEKVSDNSNYSSKSLTYKAKSSYTSKMIGGTKAVQKLEGGSVGEYKDGVARTPMIMIELRPSENSTQGYNISIPANSLVSLSHERNMSDSYNTFVLQVFDKDAMQVESKLLLGFRYILFYYTDFVATSKRFKGEILDYKTTITGKGLMLSISGYSSNASTYVGKDSIPWSCLAEAKSTSFYYWTNKMGEYLGEARVSNDGYFCSCEGNMVQPLAYPNPSEVSPYYLKVPFQSEEESGYEWKTFDEYYTDISDPDVMEKYRPYCRRFTLSVNGYNAQLDNVLADYPEINPGSKRPSDIVILICLINGWNFQVKTTKAVSEIPDQISMSYVEYIKEKLIPISVSDEKNSNTQYYFWFDDEGTAHYEPYSAADTNVKKVYFNAPDKKDTYPLIGFTSATNGSVLMVTDASNTMEAINAYTGDALSLTSVDASSKDESMLKTITETSEWYSTNKLTLRDDKSLGLISYSNTSTLPSEAELRSQLIHRWGLVSRYTYKASLDVYGCADITPGNYIDVYIYLDEGTRSGDGPYSIKETVKKIDGADELPDNYIKEYIDREYIGNLTMHHTSGRYIVNKITDTISAGKYISSLEVLKIDKNKILETVEYDESTQSENKKQETVGEDKNLKEVKETEKDGEYVSYSF